MGAGASSSNGVCNSIYNKEAILAAAKKTRERALVSYHLKHHKVLGHDALAKLEAMTQVVAIVISFKSYMFT
jgi:hypothetical protein